MDKTLILMQGIPGSGKSTIAKMLSCAFRNDGFGPQVAIRSTDEFWGEGYDYVPERAGFAHTWNQDRVRKDMIAHFDCIIVDNTNIRKAYVKPYLEMAAENGYVVQIVRVSVPIEVALARNAARLENRRVPEDVVREMAAAMEKLDG